MLERLRLVKTCESHVLIAVAARWPLPFLFKFVIGLERVWQPGRDVL
jgi:hypothetical protein